MTPSVLCSPAPRPRTAALGRSCVCIAALAALAALCASCAMNAPAERPTPRAARLPALPSLPTHSSALRWLPRGDRLIVDNRWVMDVTGSFTRLPVIPNGHALHFTRDGERLAIVGDGQIRVGKLGGDIAPGTEIPAWVKAPKGEAAPPRDELVEVAFWIDDAQLFVQQFHPHRNLEPVCKTLNPETRAWSAPAGGCVAGDFHHIWRLTPGNTGEVLIESSGEGLMGVQVARYATKEGQKGLNHPALDLFPYGPARVSLGAGGKRLDVVTPCQLERDAPKPCVDITEDSPWRHYIAPLPGDMLILKSDKLPPGAAPHPHNGTFAWISDAKVCMGRPNSADPGCIDMPDLSDVPPVTAP